MAKRLDVSDVINVREFLAKWDNRVYHMCAEESASNTAKLSEQMNITEENVKELESVCR